MASTRTLTLVLLALLVASFGLAAHLQPQFEFLHLTEDQQHWTDLPDRQLHPLGVSRARGDIFAVVLGDARRMFAQSFYVKADEYYHSGYYPSIFDDNTAFQTTHMAADTGAVNDKNRGDEHGFLGRPRNWIDAFGRHFFPSRHTHLDTGGPGEDLGESDEVREILPWLELSADLNPDNVETYTVTAFWLRERMNKVAEADAVLHEGLRNCPDSYDILFELGRLYYENYHDINRARNVWELAVSKWDKLNPESQKENRLIMEQLTANLANLEDKAGNYGRALHWYERAKNYTLVPQDMDRQINRVKWEIYQAANPELKPLY